MELKDNRPRACCSWLCMYTTVTIDMVAIVFAISWKCVRNSLPAVKQLWFFVNANKLWTNGIAYNDYHLNWYLVTKSRLRVQREGPQPQITVIKLTDIGSCDTLLHTFHQCIWREPYSKPLPRRRRLHMQCHDDVIHKWMCKQSIKCFEDKLLNVSKGSTGSYGVVSDLEMHQSVFNRWTSTSGL
jgi:hypothetical protein